MCLVQLAQLNNFSLNKYFMYIALSKETPVCAASIKTFPTWSNTTSTNFGTSTSISQQKTTSTIDATQRFLFLSSSSQVDVIVIVYMTTTKDSVKRQFKQAAGECPWPLLHCKKCTHTFASSYQSDPQFEWSLKLKCKCGLEWWICRECCVQKAHMDHLSKAKDMTGNFTK